MPVLIICGSSVNGMARPRTSCVISQPDIRRVVRLESFANARPAWVTSESARIIVPGSERVTAVRHPSNHFHGFDADQSDRVIEEMGEGEQKQDQSCHQPDPLSPAPPHKNVHARTGSVFAVGSGVCAPILGHGPVRANSRARNCHLCRRFASMESSSNMSGKVRSASRPQRDQDQFVL